MTDTEVEKWEEKLGNLENSKEYVSVSAEMQKQGVL